jgi:hypothetical protein
MTILCHDSSTVDGHLKGIGKLQVQSGCKGYSTITLIYGRSVVGNTSMQIAGELLSEIDLKFVFCEELGVRVNLIQIAVETAYRKTTAYLDDLIATSERLSNLLEKLNEEEWKNNHVMYRNTHSVLLISTVSVILFYLISKLYAHTSRWMPTCFCRKDVQATPTDMPHGMGQGNQQNTSNNSRESSEDSLKVANPTPPHM